MVSRHGSLYENGGVHSTKKIHYSRTMHGLFETENTIMNTIASKRKTLVAALICLVAVAFLAGCSGFHPIGPKRAKSSNFLRKVERNCGRYRVGGHTVTSLFSMNTSEPLFVSWTSALGSGDISKEKYAKSINGFYQNSDNEAAIRCIVRQKGSGRK